MPPTLFGEHFDRLHGANVVLSARARYHKVDGFPGPLSVKSVVKGEATWGVAGQRFTVDRSCCLIVDNGEPYDMLLESAEPVETFIVFFADGFVGDIAATRLWPLERLLDAMGEGGGAELPVTRRLWSADTNLMRALAAFRRAGACPQGEADQRLRAVLDGCADLAAQVRREVERIAAAKAGTRAELHRRAVRGKALLDDMVVEPFDLDAAAREACLSPHHFHRTFKASFGRTPYSHVALRRIERAKRLLIEEDTPVAEVCAAVGYDSLPSFTRAFRRHVGASPAHWRAEVRKHG